MVRLHPGSGNGGPDLFGLLDTGADYLTVPSVTAALLGINLQTLRTDTLTVASGGHVRIAYTQLDVTILGKRVPQKVYFGGPITLIGRVPILDVMDFGIDAQGWLPRVI